MHGLLSWAILAMHAMVPPGVAENAKGERRETTEARAARYAEIAEAAAAVAFDPKEAPVFPGEDGRLKTLGLILVTAMQESGFHRDVDFGLGKRARGDNGRSWCMMQLHIGSRKTPEGWSGKDLVKDRKKCFRAGLRVMRHSFRQCSYLPLEDRLAGYAAGRCNSLAGKKHSRKRVAQMQRLLAAFPLKSESVGMPGFAARPQG